MTSAKKLVPYFDIPDAKPYSALIESKVVISKLFSDKGIDFQRFDSSDKTIFELRGKGAYSYPLGESRCIVYPISINSEEVFQISLGVLFSHIANKFLFSGISLKVYKLVSEEIVCLFRAEWDAVKENDFHAQPHWHANFTDFGKNKGEIISGKEFKVEELQEIEGVTEQKIAGVEDLAYLSKFHFAMSADWHNGGRHSVRLKDEKALANWLKGCMEYIILQLSYVSSKH